MAMMTKRNDHSIWMDIHSWTGKKNQIMAHTNIESVFGTRNYVCISQQQQPQQEQKKRKKWGEE